MTTATHLCRTRRIAMIVMGTAAAAACMAGVLAVFNAPLAIEVDPLQRRLLLGFLPIYLAAGAVLSWFLGPPVSRSTPQHPG